MAVFTRIWGGKSMAAWFWLIAWGLWWLIISTGAQGATPVMALIALLAFPKLTQMRWPFPPDLWFFLAFLAWGILSSLWSDGAKQGFVTIDFANENFAVEAPGLRITLGALLTLFAFWSLHHIPERFYQRVRYLGAISVSLQLVIFLIAVVASGAFLSFYSQFSDEGSLKQNILRAVNMSILAMPLLAAFLPVRSLWLRLAAALGGIVICILLTFQTEGDSALIAIALIGIACALASLMGRLIYRLLGVLTASLIMFMPVIMTGILSLASTVGGSLPLSYQSRILSYDYVLGRIQEKWLLGWGVEASRGWKETAEFNVNGTIVDYPLVPGHPHNAGLQVWAETGLIGALLLAASIVLLGERLYRTGNAAKPVILCAVTLWAGAIVYPGLAYSLWNDGFWTGLAFLATGVLALSKIEQRSPSAL